MHTASYDNLQKRLASSGRDYFEGFSHSDFDGLASDELAEIKGILLARARRGDGVSLDALRQILPSDEFFDFASALLQENLADLFAAQLVTAVCEDRCSESAWTRALQLLSHGDGSARRWLLNKLPSNAIPDTQKIGLLKTLADLIQKESDQGMLIGESSLLLLTKGFAPRSPELATYAKRLQSPDLRERKQTLIELGC